MPPTIAAMISLRSALGRAIARLRAKEGLSQERFALRAKIARTYFAGIERGRHNVSIDLLERIARALDLDTGELLAEAESERRSRTARS